MKGRAFITGCTGFIGSHLADRLVGEGWRIWGTTRGETRNVAHLGAAVTLTTTDICDRAAIEAVVRDARPHVVFHLAGQTLIGPSWADPEATFRVNVFGTLYLLDALRVHAPRAVVVVAGSSAAYGAPDGSDEPLRESAPFRPGSPYGASKVAVEMLACSYVRGHGMAVRSVRPFAIIGPRKRGDAVSDWAAGIARIERGEATELAVGDVEGARDFVDVRDAVRALVMVAESGGDGEAYNVCSGEPTPLRQVVDELVTLARRPVSVVLDASRFRRGDDRVLLGDNARLRGLGWKPEIPLRQTLVDTLEHWRAWPRAGDR